MAYNLLEKVYRTQTSPIQTFLFNVGRSSLSLTYGPQSIQYRLRLHTPGLYSPQTLSHFTQRVLNSMHCKSVIAEAPYLTWNPSEKFW